MANNNNKKLAPEAMSALDKCKNEEPVIKDIGNGHLCACHLVD